MGSLAFGFVSALVIKTNPLQTESGLRNNRLIRPPGALPEENFVSVCSGCGECLKVCPNNALQSMKISVRGEIVAPDGEENNRREILVRDKVEYDRLPIDEYPITHANKPEGIGVRLINGDHKCEASSHRYGKGSRYGEVFYIASAFKRLGSKDYTRKFRTFLEEVEAIDEGTFVKLEFEQYKICISKI